MPFFGALYELNLWMTNIVGSNWKRIVSWIVKVNDKKRSIEAWLKFKVFKLPQMTKFIEWHALVGSFVTWKYCRHWCPTYIHVAMFLFLFYYLLFSFFGYQNLGKIWTQNSKICRIYTSKTKKFKIFSISLLKIIQFFCVWNEIVNAKGLEYWSYIFI